MKEQWWYEDIQGTENKIFWLYFMLGCSKRAIIEFLREIGTYMYLPSPRSRLEDY